MAAVEHESRAAREHETVTRDEFRAELEARVMAEFGLSLGDFSERLRSGELDTDDPAVAEVAFLVRMLERAERRGEGSGHRRGLTGLLARLARPYKLLLGGIMLKLYEYAVILQPKVSKDGEQKEEGKVVVPVTAVLAKDDAQATMLAARSIPEEFIDRIDRLTVVVRPF